MTRKSKQRGVHPSSAGRTVRLGHRRRNAEFFVRLTREKPLGVVGGVIVLMLLLAGIFADMLAPYGMNEMQVINMMAGPSAEHWLGTDQLGRDILTRLIFGARISVVVGLTATTTSVLVASLIGVPSAYFGGTYDIVVQRFVDAWVCIPGLLVLLTVLSIVGQGMVQIVLVMGITGGIGSSRLVRSAVIGIKENDYFQAAEAIGGTHRGTLLRHIMPNIMPPIIIVFSIGIGGAIISEAGLSFLGFGLPPEVPSWGGMLSGDGRMYMEAKPELAIYPGLCLFVVVYGVNMLGDAVRDLLDPRLSGLGIRAVGRRDALKGKRGQLTAVVVGRK